MRLTRRSGRFSQATRGHRQARQVSAVNTGLVGPSRHAGAYIKALDDPWLDTTTPHGELILTVVGGLHEFERKLIRCAAMKASSEPEPRVPCLAASPCSMLVSAGKLPNATRLAKPCAKVGEATIWRALRG